MFSLKTLLSLFPLVLSLAGALTLSLESYLVLQGKSLCSTAACVIVGTSIRFGEPLLIGGGAVFFWLFALAYFFSRRYPKYLQHIPSVLLLSALAFDGTIIGFQIFTLDQRCLLCLFVATLLIALALSHAISQKSSMLFFGALGIWLGGFMALGILKMPLPAGAYANMAFYEYKTETTSATKLAPHGTGTYTFTLIMSMNCPHCLDVVSYLSNNLPIATSFKLVAIDQDQDSLKKISKFRKEAAQDDNPFKHLQKIKEDLVLQHQDIAEDLLKKSRYGQQFLTNLGITSIPVLFAESNTNKELLIGSDVIINFLQNAKGSKQTLGDDSP